MKNAEITREYIEVTLEFKETYYLMISLGVTDEESWAEMDEIASGMNMIGEELGLV